jgi:hypothetical protein
LRLPLPVCAVEAFDPDGRFALVFLGKVFVESSLTPMSSATVSW